jgi:hypothetical protein
MSEEVNTRYAPHKSIDDVEHFCRWLLVQNIPLRTFHFEIPAHVPVRTKIAIKSATYEEAKKLLWDDLMPYNIRSWQTEVGDELDEDLVGEIMVESISDVDMTEVGNDEDDDDLETFVQTREFGKEYPVAKKK